MQGANNTKQVVKIAVDAMGVDYAPEEIVKGAVKAANIKLLSSLGV